MAEGRYVYQKNGLYRLLAYIGNHNYRGWVVNLGGEHTMDNFGGSVCPEDIKNKWKTSIDDKIDNKKDPQIKITCIKKTADHSVKNKTTTTTATAETTTHTTATTTTAATTTKPTATTTGDKARNGTSHQAS